VPNPEVGCAYSITSSARARRDAGIDTEQFRCLEIDDKQEFGGLLRSLEVCGLTGQINPTHIVDDQNEDRPRLGPSLIEQAPRSASTNRLSGINASASLRRTGPAPHGRGVARLLSDCHAAAVEAREGEAVEGFAEGSALVPQHADSHFLAERH
jgi:hypothetical protein